LDFDDDAEAAMAAKENSASSIHDHADDFFLTRARCHALIQTDVSITHPAT
jgi:hypothetical protein